MTRKSIIKMILLQFGYHAIEVETFKTGTADGQWPNSTGYEIEAVKDGWAIEVHASCFQEAVQDLFCKILDTDMNERIVHYINETEFQELK